MVIISAKELKNKDPNISHQINSLLSLSFKHENTVSYIDYLKDDDYVGYLVMDNKIVTAGLSNKDTYNSEYKYKTLYLNSFGTHPEYRGLGLCKNIISEFIRKFGKEYILYLTVRTQENNVNESAIRCYKKNGFVMLPEVYRDHHDGKNSAMIRIPEKKKATKKKKLNKKKKKHSKKIKK